MEQTAEFKALNLAIMTVSDTRTRENDSSGATLVSRARAAGHTVLVHEIVPDERREIEGRLEVWIRDPGIDVVISTGGTGVTGRDVTPEAFAAVWEKEIPGFGELFRWISLKKIGTAAIQSRATAGVANGTYLFALPGSSGAVRDAWDEILVHQLDSRTKPCNFADLLPRLKER